MGHLGGVLRLPLNLGQPQRLDVSVRCRRFAACSSDNRLRLLLAPSHLRLTEGCELAACLQEALTLLLGRACHRGDLRRELLCRLFLAQQKRLLLNSNFLCSLDRRS